MPNLSSLVPSGMFQFIISRLLRSLVTLIIFQLLLFGLIQAVNTSLPADIEAMELAVSFQEDLGELIMMESAKSEPPVEEQFLGWMTAFYRGDLGESSSLGGEPVVEILKTRLPKSLLLLIPGTIGGFLLGMWLGKRVAWRKRGWIEFAATLGGTAFYTSFPPWLAFVMINVFGLSLDWFPPEKIIDPMKWAFQEGISLNDVIVQILLTLGAGICAYSLVVWLSRNYAHRKSLQWRISGGVVILILMIIPWIVNGRWPLVLDILNHLVLPLATLILLAFGETMLIMKTTMTEAVVSEHVAAAKAKGLPDVRVRDRHAARVAILPVLTRFVVHLPLIIIGSFVVEYLFYWDGMGQELIRAANDNDLPVLMGVLSIVGIGILIMHTFLDILVRWLDPRLRKVRVTSRLLKRMS
jgi:peptide/nickel transport system permease protein